MNDNLSNEFKKNVYLKPDEYLNGWARRCGWKATLVYDSLWRHADKERRCFPSIRMMAEEHGVDRRIIIKGIRILEEYGLLRREQNKNKNGRFLNNTYFLTDKAQWHEAVVHDKYHGHRGASQVFTVVHDGYHKDTHIKGTHKTPLIVPPKKKEYSSLGDISEEDLREISGRYGVSLDFVKLQLEKLTNYCEAKGRVYKNYKSALRNFVLGDAKGLVQPLHTEKVQPIPDLPERIPDKKWAELRQGISLKAGKTAKNQVQIGA